MRASVLLLFLPVAALGASGSALAQATPDDVYKANCARCHDAGLGGAPRAAERADWEARIAKGRPAIIRSVIYGMPNGAKPARAGNADLTDREITMAVDWLLATLGDLPVSSYSRPARIEE